MERLFPDQTGLAFLCAYMQQSAEKQDEPSRFISGWAHLLKEDYSISIKAAQRVLSWPMSEEE